MRDLRWNAVLLCAAALTATLFIRFVRSEEVAARNLIHPKYLSAARNLIEHGELSAWVHREAPPQRAYV